MTGHQARHFCSMQPAGRVTAHQCGRFPGSLDWMRFFGAADIFVFGRGETDQRLEVQHAKLSLVCTEYKSPSDCEPRKHFRVLKDEQEFRLGKAKYSQKSYCT